MPKLEKIKNGGTLNRQLGISEFTPTSSSDDNDGQDYDDYDDEDAAGDVGIDADWNAKSFSIKAYEQSNTSSSVCLGVYFV